MRKTKYTVKPTTQFKKDYKRAMKRGLKIELLEKVVELLAMGEALPEKNRDHELSGTGLGIGNATSSRTGCLFTASRTMCWC